MTLNLTIPGLNAKSSSVKDQIISVLSREWPLTSKELFSRIKKQFASNISYQAVHKTVKELLDERILVQKEKVYQLNQKWIAGIKKFALDLSESYSNDVSSLKENQSMHLTFNNFTDFGHFVINEYHFIFPNPEKKDGCCFWKHAHGALGVTDKEFANLKRIFSECTHYAICARDTFLDKWFSAYMNKIKKWSVTGVKSSAPDYLFVHGDYLLEVFLSPELDEKMDKFYNKVKDTADFNPEKYLEIVSEPSTISVLITKNSSLADKFRKEAKRLYEANK